MSYKVDFSGKRKIYSNGTLFVQTATATSANSVAEDTISSTGEGSLDIPANFLKVGSSLRIKAFGFHSSTGNPTITLKIKFGSTVICTVTGTSGNGSNDDFELEGIITCRTTGSTGTVFGQAKYIELQNSGLIDSSGNTTTTTVNTTISNTVSITAQWGTANAGNTISLTNFILEAFYPT